MFGFNKAKTADVLSHWYTLVDQFNIPCKDFYTGVEHELTNRKVPGLQISRVFFSEGGILSANREYLRMKRERLVFDICAAPFGVSYFFSMRFAELPVDSFLPQAIGLLVGIVVIFGICVALLGFILGPIVGIILSVFLLWFAVNLRNESYYRQDTRLMYLEVVNAVVKQKIAEFTSSAGINLLDIRQHSPLMDDLYRTTRIDIDAVETPPPVPPIVPEPVPA